MITFSNDHSLKKSQQPDVKNKGFQYLNRMIHDPFLPIKLKFFEMISSKLNVFLRGFQINKPMVPFFADTNWSSGKQADPGHFSKVSR